MRVLGFDIGVASIGWALVEDSVLKDCGVRIFTKAENPKDGSSLALPRREARSVRRRLARRKARLNELKRLVKFLVKILAHAFITLLAHYISVLAYRLFYLTAVIII